MDRLVKSIGMQIRLLRKSKNLSQEELAFRAEVHPTYIGQVERGEKKSYYIQPLSNYKCFRS